MYCIGIIAKFRAFVFRVIIFIAVKIFAMSLFTVYLSQLYLSCYLFAKRKQLTYINISKNLIDSRYVCVQIFLQDYLPDSFFILLQNVFFHFSLRKTQKKKNK